MPHLLKLRLETGAPSLLLYRPYGQTQSQKMGKNTLRFYQQELQSQKAKGRKTGRGEGLVWTMQYIALCPLSHSYSRSSQMQHMLTPINGFSKATSNLRIILQVWDLVIYIRQSPILKRTIALCSENTKQNNELTAPTRSHTHRAYKYQQYTPPFKYGRLLAVTGPQQF